MRENGAEIGIVFGSCSFSSLMGKFFFLFLPHLSFSFSLSASLHCAVFFVFFGFVLGFFFCVVFLSTVGKHELERNCRCSTIANICILRLGGGGGGQEKREEKKRAGIKSDCEARSRTERASVLAVLAQQHQPPSAPPSHCDVDVRHLRAASSGD